MTALVTSLPSTDETENRSVMTIRHVQLSMLPQSILDVNIELNSSQTPLNTTVYKIAPEVIEGYLPSRIWTTDTDLILMYYVCGMLPHQARPFANQDCYVIVCRDISPSTVIQYDASARIFVDQVFDRNSNQVSYVFIFGADQARRMMLTDWTGQPWTYDTTIVPDIDQYVK